MHSFRNPLAIALAGLIGFAASAANAQSIVNPALPVIPDGSFNITNYGAIGDGVMTNTTAIQAAINAATNAGGGTVVVPAGTFLSGPIRLASGINLHLDGGAVLRMLPLDKYPGGTEDPANFISGGGLHDVAISGSGMIDGDKASPGGLMRARGARDGPS